MITTAPKKVTVRSDPFHLVEKSPIIQSLCSNVIYRLVSVVSERECKPCQKGWTESNSSCHRSNDTDEKTWKEAQQACSEENSYLAIILNEDDRVMRKLWNS